MATRLEDLALTETDTFPIRHEGQVYEGKVRTVYWLTQNDSSKVLSKLGKQINGEIGIMIISDRISAFNSNWKGDELKGVPGKGASLNAVSEYWFREFAKEGFACTHLLEVPHPLVWIVRKAQPIKIEAVLRHYITGSLLKEYKEGARTFCGITLDEGLKEHQKLRELLFTPTTKGTLKGLRRIPEEEDTNLTREQIIENYSPLGFDIVDDINQLERLAIIAFNFISRKLSETGQIFVDTKFEFGYFITKNRWKELGYIDEVGTPDSSRIWDAKSYESGKVIENSKEFFRKFLKDNLDNELLTDEKRKSEREKLARKYNVPADVFIKISDIYIKMVKEITGKNLPKIEKPREEIMDVLSKLGILE